MSRWGKPTKNKKIRNPRYFLNEDRIDIRTVQQGDTLSSLYGSVLGRDLSRDEIQRVADWQNSRAETDPGLSRIGNIDQLQVGDRIMVPGEVAANELGLIPEMMQRGPGPLPVKPEHSIDSTRAPGNRDLDAESERRYGPAGGGLTLIHI